MINLHLEEDLALKRFVTTPKEQKPSFNWRGVVEAEPSDQSEIKIICPQGDESFDIKEVVNTIGKALTNVLLSRQEKDIFTEENKQWVEQISRKVGENLLTQADANMPVRVGLNDLYIIIEKTLVEHNAFDVAKSILLDRSKKMTTEYAQSAVAIRLIRRNGQVVPWNEAKIEIAVRKAFLSLELDSSPAAEVALRVTKRLMRIRQAFIHIEEVQDMVQEELMRGGHFKVAAHYIIYRERRATHRETEEDVEAEVPEQNSMVVVNLPDGESHFWDGTDLKKRIEFASIGLRFV